MRYKKELYVDFDPYEGDRGIDIRCRTVKLVKTRKNHVCTSIGGDGHTMPRGKIARCESAIIDDQWGSNYLCTTCMDKYFDEEFPMFEDFLLS